MRFQTLLLIAAVWLVTALPTFADTIVVYKGTGTESKDASGARVRISNSAYFVLDSTTDQFLFVLYAKSTIAQNYYTFEPATAVTKITNIVKGTKVYKDFIANQSVNAGEYVEIARASGPVGTIALPGGGSVNSLTSLNFLRTISNLSSSPEYWVFNYNLTPNLALTKKLNGGTYADAKAAVIKKLTDAGYTAGP